MTGRQFVLGVDLDGVVADFARGLKPIAAEWLGVPESGLTDEISYGFTEWRLDDAGGYDALHRFAVKERELFARLPPLDGAPAALRRLIPYWDLCFMRDKAAVGADLYLEDNPANIESLRATGHETIVVVNPTNRHLPGPRASGWTEIEQLVRQRVAAWRDGT